VTRLCRQMYRAACEGCLGWDDSSLDHSGLNGDPQGSVTLTRRQEPSTVGTALEAAHVFRHRRCSKRWSLRCGERVEIVAHALNMGARVLGRHNIVKPAAAVALDIFGLDFYGEPPVSRGAADACSPAKVRVMSSSNCWPGVCRRLIASNPDRAYAAQASRWGFDATQC
jgi:hypothetical protein